MQNPKNSYLATKVLTASPEQLRLMLFDGAIQFAHKAVRALETGDLESSYETLSQAKKIVIELITSLNPDVNPEVCQKMSAVYTYVYKLMVDASFEKDKAKLTDAIQILEYERETWQLLINKVHSQEDEAGEALNESINQVETKPASPTSLGSKWVPGPAAKNMQSFSKTLAKQQAGQTGANDGTSSPPTPGRLSVSG